MSLDQSFERTAPSHGVSAFFDTHGAAQKAIDDLVKIGIARDQISLLAGQGGGSVVGEQTAATQDKGFWEELKDLFLPDEDRHVYAEGLRRGGFLVTVHTDMARYARILEILDADGAVDMSQRETEWRSSGWAGFNAGEPANPTADRKEIYSADPRTATAAGAAGRDEVIPVYEEQLRVGKRDVSHGRVRIRSFVVETPVHEQVSLHSESIQVDRRPVDRAVSADDALFQDRVIEVEERAEEAVIAKEVRVTEEVSLRKTVENTTRTVNDTVRHTEVEIDDQRGRGLTGSAPRFSAATDAAMIREHMDVIASDGTKIGTVDHLEGPDRIKLAKTTSPDGQHHFVPLTWVDHVDAHVHLNKSPAEAKAGW